MEPLVSAQELQVEALKAGAMESPAALGLASNVIEFVDFTSKLLSTAHTLYISTTGTTAENAEHKTLAKHIRALADNACPPTVAAAGGAVASTSNPQNHPTPRPDALQDIAKQCCNVADEFLLLFASFSVQGSHRTWKSICTALRSAPRSPNECHPGET
jgi:hypothetical protein